MRAAFLAMLMASTTVVPSFAKPPARLDDRAALARVMDEGFNHSQVMVTAEWLDDHIGSRMTGSPGMRAAESWTQDKFRGWGAEERP